MLPRASRHGLTRCGTCATHIRAQERPSETDCPFCGANLHRGGGRIAAGRGGVLAASLLAFSLAACGGKTDLPVEPDACDAGPAGSCVADDDPDAGPPADEFDAGPPVDDPPPTARYGLPPG